MKKNFGTILKVLFFFIAAFAFFASYGCYKVADDAEKKARAEYEEALKKQQAKPRERVRVLQVNDNTSRPKSGVRVVPIEGAKPVSK